MSLPIYHLGFALFNLLLVILLSPLLEGIIRKLVALVHSRIGPPLIQPYLDILKLLGKEEIVSSDNFFFRYSPVFSFGAILLVALLVPIGAPPPLNAGGDILVFIYILSFAAVMVMLSGVTSESPFGVLGAAREMMMVLTVEPVIVIALIVAAIKANSLQFGSIITHFQNNSFPLSMVLVGIALFISIVAQLARLPFDIVEADQEIMEGPFIEQSGPKLALFKWSFYAKELIFAAVFVSIFVPWLHSDVLIINFIYTLLKILVLLLVVGVVHVVNPRLRIDQAVRYFAVLIFVTIIGLAFALAGS
jgi:formate hydrogenlyase subunit 4